MASFSGLIQLVEYIFKFIFNLRYILLNKQACVPYMEILEKWIYKGIINDPYSEVCCHKQYAP